MHDPCPIKLRGIVPSLNTPFTADDKVDLESLRRLIDWTVASGCAGMLFPAVAGEGTSLSKSEFETLVGTVVQHTAGRIPTIVAVSSEDPAQRLERARCAKAFGADGVCCQVPAGLRGETLHAALTVIADAAPPLLMVQDLDWTGTGLPIPEIVDLCERIPSFSCIKVETQSAGPKYSAILEATGRKLHVSGGWAASQMPDALARGVHAFMPTELEATYVAVYRLHAAGKTDEAVRLFESLKPILAFSNQHVHVSIRFFKQLRKARGLFATDLCRPPVPELDAEKQREADHFVQEALKR